MGNKAAKRVRDHPDLLPGEQVLDACWGAGKGLLRMADIATIGGVPGQIRYADEAKAATDGGGGSEAARIDRNGILALTDQRLLFLPVKTAVRKPAAVAAAWPLDQLAGVGFEKPMLVVGFADGSTGGLHVPRAEGPAEFAATAAARLGSA